MFNPPTSRGEMQILAFMQIDFDEPADIHYGVAMYYRPSANEYITWRCVSNNDGVSWEFWNGHYFTDEHAARDSFAWRANLRPTHFEPSLAARKP